MAVDVLVINLTRFGDLLQSQGVIDDLVKAGHKVGLVCLENFAPATRLMRGVAEVWPLPGARLLAGVDKAWQKAAVDIIEFAQTIRAEAEPKVILNLTPTLPARLLARLLAGPQTQTLGFGMDENGYGVNHGVWANFIAVAARRRLNAPFNLSDMLRKLGAAICRPMAGSHELAAPAAEMIEWAKNFVASESAGDIAGYAAFQLGASEERRQWPVGHFRKLGQMLWDNFKLCPVLLGTAAEQPLAQEYLASCGHPTVNAVGKTSLEQLAALLKTCRLLVTNDTGTMHLAAGLGVPGVGFFLATAQPWDTGPLMPGWCCIEPKMDCHPCAFGVACAKNNACRSIVKPEDVFELIASWLHGGQWLTDKAADNMRVWLTGKSPKGLARVFATMTAQAEARSQFLEVMREFWEALLDALTDNDANAPQAVCPHQLKNFPQAAHIAQTLSQAVALLGLICQSSDIALASARGGQILLRNCERLQTVLDQCAPLETVAAFWREYRQNQDTGLDRFFGACAILRTHLQGLMDAFV